MQQPVVGGAATVLVARALGLTQETALALAIVRGGRMLCWQFAGTLLLVRHGISTRRILQDRELQGGRAGELPTSNSQPPNRATRTTG
jgi:hypothetical protein